MPIVVTFGGEGDSARKDGPLGKQQAASIAAGDMQDAPNSFHGIVRGRVQRVGFRVFVRESAIRQGVHGWVRNLANGCVEVYAEGDEIALTELLTDLYRGPVLSHVADIQLEWKLVETSHDTFDILR